MANRKKIDRKGRPYKKMDRHTYEGYRDYEIKRRWVINKKHRNKEIHLSKKGNKKLYLYVSPWRQ